MRRFIPKTFVALLAAGLLLAPVAWSRDRGSSHRQSPDSHPGNQEMLPHDGHAPAIEIPRYPRNDSGPFPARNERVNSPTGDTPRSFRLDDRKRPIPAGVTRPVKENGTTTAPPPFMRGQENPSERAPAFQHPGGWRHDGRRPHQGQPTVRPPDIQAPVIRPPDIRQPDIRPPGSRPHQVRPHDGSWHDRHPGRVHDAPVYRHPEHRVIHHPPPGYTTVRHRHDVYHYHSGRFYRPVSNGFIVVAPPLGIVVPFLPIGFRTVISSGLTFCVSGDTWYRPVTSGYEVVAPPVIVSTPVARAYQGDLWAPGAMVSVDIDLLNVRSGPGRHYDVLRVVRRGTVLEIQRRSDDWLYVWTPDGDAGWVMIQYTVPAANFSNG